MPIDKHQLKQAYEKVRDQLLAERNDAGHWVGQLSNSAVSTATAVSAIALLLKHYDEYDGPISRERLQELVDGGVRWLLTNQNPDGGWGDTDRSRSNIAAAMLSVAALTLSGQDESFNDVITRANQYIDAEGRLDGLKRRYGKDKTFAVPILSTCALAGLVPWKKVFPLPFELAIFPHSFYRFLRMPVVSYAIPALVAIGQGRYHHCKPMNPISRVIRHFARRKSLDRVRAMQPESGGFLEAAPLTAFVSMNLISVGQANHPIVHNGIRFLAENVTEDGGWPIDTNLATWLTTLSINALATGGEDLSDENVLDPRCIDWLLSCQHREVHPFTNAAPGGWGWTDLSGNVPDADDTPGALLALVSIHNAIVQQNADDKRLAMIYNQVADGGRWLHKLRNRNGGWPTFCRGWGKLPFDRSGVDLTAHAIRATLLMAKRIAKDSRSDSEWCVNHIKKILLPPSFRYMERQQRPDGSWAPLWFGNQYHPDEENPIYGTARVLLAYRDAGLYDSNEAIRGMEFLLNVQNEDGGWGDWSRESAENHTWTSSVEETAVVIEAITLDAEICSELQSLGYPDLIQRIDAATERAADWLIERVDDGTSTQPTPIGFYFAKLWYYERLYPQIFTLAALGQLKQCNTTE